MPHHREEKIYLRNEEKVSGTGVHRSPKTSGLLLFRVRGKTVLWFGILETFRFILVLEGILAI